jgi:hypothetical protein
VALPPATSSNTMVDSDFETRLSPETVHPIATPRLVTSFLYQNEEEPEKELGASARQLTHTHVTQGVNCSRRKAKQTEDDKDDVSRLLNEYAPPLQSLDARDVQRLYRTGVLYNIWRLSHGKLYHMPLILSR